jgi:hypothetical protein
MYKPTIYKPLKIGNRFNVAFPGGVPANSDVDKSKTALGITYSEMKAKRHSILAFPSVAIIEDKCNSEEYAYIKPFKIIEDVTSEMIALELLREDGYKYKKLLVTPDSFPKIIEAAKSIGRLQWLFDNFFCFLDESHCYANEAFRDDILNPFKYIDRFASAAMGSATPFPYSHPRFKKFQKYKITFKEKFGVITLINDESPQAVMMHFLKNPDMFPGRVHIYFNSVTGTGNLINTSGITDVMVSCRLEDKNIVNLGEAEKYFIEHPTEKDFKKFNFYSSRYNEGWDLKDDSSATMILLTDTSIPHSMVGIQYKGFQAVGRLRTETDNKPHKIYHITNNLGLQGTSSLARIQKTRLYNANAHIKQYNEHKAACKRDGELDLELLKPVIQKFADFDNEKAYLNEDKLDQISCAQFCREGYNSNETIKAAWEMCNYDVEEIKYSLPSIHMGRKSSSVVNREIVNHIQELRKHPEKYVFGAVSAFIKSYRNENYIVIDAIEILGVKRIEELEYDTKAMKTELIERSNNNVESQLRVMVAATFKLNDRYTNKYIKLKLQEFYNELGIKKADGSPKVATARQLKELGMFGMEEGKAENEKGEKKTGWIIYSLNYTLSKAA